MVRIFIGEDWVITSDTYQFILSQKKTVQAGSKAGEEWLCAVGYYPTITQLVAGLVHHRIRNSTVTSVASLAAEIEHIGKQCQEAFSSSANEDK